ncbi:PhzF family phenazine biosynthesis protein [Bordetella holmesii]|uniref:Phenazine biosynthesis protein, PhzF family n=3 Tax=Bordetella holmesii TaxID=35814 RepID=A0A158M338_9BORD|nr:phenazine biosynthesis protein PhzC/PhzF [Bordetella holmesii H558]AOB34869.1 phenazine biosynthesis protein PhzC/PhzF [Bordetella holmesii]EWM51834.1 phenazine biosynthesis, PhzF family protein [Bordetella holmesii 70147]EXF87135.1 phenazine biosynthesis, PhzF family protein [Bordetella holmesii 30539]EXX93139.1 phenazine biosynthesis, PhzF family protein [Bordetella holmesii 1058]KAK84249.1 phenazine biosynthesis protein, PhzF family [Bordetella holmesii CDC-H572-BH]KAK89005.1 phenazine 
MWVLSPAFGRAAIMPDYRYRLVNVFADSVFGGNPLCVFEDARGMSREVMRDLALQFNLSETTFVLDRTQPGVAEVCIMTPTHEMAFAGHPSLGTAHVLRELGQASDDTVVLSLPAGKVPVVAQGDVWTLVAPSTGAPGLRRAGVSRADVAAFLGLSVEDLAGDPVWVDTGIEQCVVPLVSPEAVKRAAPRDCLQWEDSRDGRRVLYAFAFAGQQRAGREVVCARYFSARGAGVVEDPGTGSACANLGGWLQSQGREVAGGVLVEQGDLVRRPCRLFLDVDPQGGQIRVGGQVRTLGGGTIHLP